MVDHPDGEVRKAYLITGRVQGVGFRYWTMRNARQLGLRGTVRNRRDGRVELHVAGAPDAVRRLETRLPDGPPSAQVEEWEEVEPMEELPSEFRIIR